MFEEAVIILMQVVFYLKQMAPEEADEKYENVMRQRHMFIYKTEYAATSTWTYVVLHVPTSCPATSTKPVLMLKESLGVVCLTGNLLGTETACGLFTRESQVPYDGILLMQALQSAVSVGHHHR